MAKLLAFFIVAAAIMAVDGKKKRRRISDCKLFDFQGENVGVLCFNDFSGTGGAEGRIFIGGNAQLTSFDVASSLGNSRGDRDDLVVGGTISYHSGVVGNGNIVFAQGGTDEITQGVRYGLSAGNTIKNEAPKYDFHSAETHFSSLSRDFSKMIPTGTVGIAWGTILLTTNKNNTDDLQIFNMKCEDLLNNNYASLKIECPESATVIVNVLGVNDCGFSGGIEVPDASKVIWNFPDAEKVLLAYSAVQGAILAPTSLISANNGDVHGQIVVGSWNGQSRQVNNPFTGQCPPAMWELADQQPAAELDKQASLDSSDDDDDDEDDEVVDDDKEEKKEIILKKKKHTHKKHKGKKAGEKTEEKAEETTVVVGKIKTDKPIVVPVDTVRVKSDDEKQFLTQLGGHSLVGKTAGKTVGKKHGKHHGKKEAADTDSALVSNKNHKHKNHKGHKKHKKEE